MEAKTQVIEQLQLTIARDALLPALQTVAGVVERRQTLPILGNVLLNVTEDELQLTGTDLEVELTATVKLATAAQAAGRITVPARKLMDICRTLPDDAVIELKLDTQILTVQSGHSRFQLACLPANEFPRAPALPDATPITLSNTKLAQLFSATHFAMAQQDVRYFLNGSLLHVQDKTITVVATDGHRLALAKQTLDQEYPESKIIVPRKAVLELMRFLQSSATEQSVTVTFSSNHICFVYDSITMVSRLVDGRFPDYHRVIPRHNANSLIINKDILKQALTRVAILANEKNRGVRLDLQPGNLKLSANNPEREQAEDNLTVQYQAEKITIGFNVSYLLDILNVLPAGDVEWLFSNSSGSVLVQYAQDSQEATYVVMPMRL